MSVAASTIEEDLETFFRNPTIDPTALYRRLRTEAPVIKDPAGTWVISRWDDAQNVAGYKTAQWGSEIRFRDRSLMGPTEKLGSLFVAAVEGEVHQRLRLLISKAFTPKIVDQLKVRIERIVDDLIDAAVEKGSLDLVNDFSYPLPITVIADMLGIEEQDRWLLVDAVSALIQAGDYNSTPQQRLHADELCQQFTDMVGRYVDDRRRSPRADILTALMEAEEAGDKLSRDELISTCFVIVGAGHETTANVLSSLIYTLLANRAHWDRLKAEPDLIPAAVEEGLRLEPPIRINRSRGADRDMELGGVVIPAGEPASVWIGAANRDDAVFEDSDTFRLDRAGNRHLAFSTGPHFCIGARLARLEMQVALKALLLRLPELQLVNPTPQWRPIVGFRSLENLFLRW